MTTWYAQNSANWDAANQWNDQAGGGGAFGTPGDGDTCFLNGKIVTMNLLTIPASGTLARLSSNFVVGSRLNLVMSGSNSYTINATAIDGAPDNNRVIDVSGAAPSATLTVNGSFTGGTGNNAVGMTTTSTGTHIINGNATGRTGGGTNNAGITHASGAGPMTVNGNVTGATTGQGMIKGSTSLLTINGNVVGGNSSFYDGIFITAASGSTVINGNVTGGTGSGGWYGVHNSFTATVTVNGTVTAGTAARAFGINNASTGVVTINGSIVNNANSSAVAGKCLYNPASGQYTQYVATGGGTFKQYREDAFVTAAQVVSGVTFWAEGASGVGSLSGFPSINDVRFGVVFGASSEYTGTVAIPAVGNVLQGVGFGYGGGTEFTGTYVVTAAADVQSGVAFGAAGAQTGTFATPAQGDVRSGVGYGEDGAEYTGTVILPATGDVIDGVLYGADGTEFEGTSVQPAEGNVLLNVQYGEDGTEFTGSLSPGAGPLIDGGMVHS